MVSMKFDLETAKEVWKEESFAEGQEENLIHNLRSLMRSMKLSKTKAMDALEVPPAMRKKISPLL